MTDFFEDLEGEVLFVVCGSSLVSAATLVILQQIHKKVNINVLYIRPDTLLLNETRKLQQRTTYNILQQYARSGLLKQIFLFENNMLQNVIGDVPIAELHKKTNELIAHTIHMMNIFHHTEPLTKTFSTPHSTARICTFGIFDLSTKQASDDLFVSYGIYSTKYDKNYAYSTSRSSSVQGG